MTLPLPGGPDPDPVRQRKFEQISQAMPGFGNASVEVRFGTGSVTFTASTSSATVTVPHGLGRVPAAVATAGKNGNAIIVAVNSVDATNIVFHADYFTALTGTFNFYWISIG